ncbi:hypothetical protein RRG08_051003 [Elysia crispata]|uniref:Uncharacterized protein n=1 Tax=Elysia crispata TaxID=231223 RepID=A0AAE1D6U5_9GAST|nr:hypothetical protein RRG08_051003 [Elysia crispata]
MIERYESWKRNASDQPHTGKQKEEYYENTGLTSDRTEDGREAHVRDDLAKGFLKVTVVNDAENLNDMIRTLKAATGFLETTLENRTEGELLLPASPVLVYHADSIQFPPNTHFSSPIS